MRRLLFIFVFCTSCKSVSSPIGAEPSSGTSAQVAQEKRAVEPNLVTNGRPLQVRSDPGSVGDGTPLKPRLGHQLAIVAGGCFWGVESTFRKVAGVTATAVGYTGGKTERPTYEAVCSHRTGHAEAVIIEFDPKVVTYAQLLDTFFQSHDPTQFHRQGPDVGDQYRSAIFPIDANQQKEATSAKENAQKSRSKPVVTSIEPLAPFWKAETYHQQYHEKTGTAACATGAKLDD